MTTIGSVLITLGAALLAVAAWGVLRLPDALARQHAATKAGTLALGTMAMGVALTNPTLEWLMRLAALAAILVVTLPVASHALALAAARSRPPPT